MKTAHELSQQYDTAVAALEAMGFGQGDGIPSLAQIATGLTPNDMEWLDWRRVQGHQDALVIAPSVQTIGLVGTAEQPGLLPRAAAATGGAVTYSATPQLQAAYRDRDREHDNAILFRPFSTSFLLGDVTDPFDPGMPANAADEPGLVHTNQTVAGQRDSLMGEKDLLERDWGIQSTRLRAASLGQLVTNTVQRQLTGQPHLDPETSTLLIHYPEQTADGRGYVPRVRSLGRHIAIGQGFTNLANQHRGIRRALRLRTS